MNRADQTRHRPQFCIRRGCGEVCPYIMRIHPRSLIFDRNDEEASSQTDADLHFAVLRDHDRTINQSIKRSSKDDRVGEHLRQTYRDRKP